MLAHQLVLGLERAGLDDGLGAHLADALEGFELCGRGLV